MGKKKTAFTAFILAALLTATVVYIALPRLRPYLEQKKALSSNWGEAELLEIRFLGQEYRLGRVSRVSQVGRAVWQLIPDDADAKSHLEDLRANSALINKILTLAKTTLTAPHLPAPKAPEDAERYGMVNPELVLAAKWASPEAGEDVFWVSRGENEYYAFFPRRGFLTKLSSEAAGLLSEKTPLDLRERRIFSFEPDDIEDLSLVPHS